MGTKYVRDTAIASEVSINSGQTVTITVEDIYPEITISNTIVPALRQATGSGEVDWVSIAPGSGSSDVVIDATSLNAGESY